MLKNTKKNLPALESKTNDFIKKIILCQAAKHIGTVSFFKGLAGLYKSLKKLTN